MPKAETAAQNAERVAGSLVRELASSLCTWEKSSETPTNGETPRGGGLLRVSGLLSVSDLLRVSGLTSVRGVVLLGTQTVQNGKVGSGDNCGVAGGDDNSYAQDLTHEWRLRAGRMNRFVSRCRRGAAAFSRAARRTALVVLRRYARSYATVSMRSNYRYHDPTLVADSF